MKSMHIKSCVSSLLIVLASACSESTDNNQSSIVPNVLSFSIPEATPKNAAQLLARASFGPNQSSIDAVVDAGLEQWVENQFTLKGPAHLDYVQQYSNGSGRAARHDIWWTQAVTGEDQLRQRMAFALSQIFVIGDVGYSLGNSQYGVTRYYDLLLENAFGNYRDLLEDITLSPVMGLYLSMLQNAKSDAESNTRADENYAREIMQLFSIGLHQLNIDGTVKMQNGRALPAYTQDDVESYARIFTGWNYSNPREWNQPLFTGGDLIAPMEPNEEYHDVDAKQLLNGEQTVVGASAQEDLTVALDSLFNHPNVGPFIGKQLIQKLVTSNPTPGYVARVASAFNDNGSGVRGDFKAVLKAVLFDDEAINGSVNQAQFGKLREPILRITHLWRAFNIEQGSEADNIEFNTLSPALENLETTIGQAPLRSPSVFNFYLPDYSPQGPAYQAGIDIPEAQIYTDNNILATTTLVSRQIQRLYLQNPDSTQSRWSSLNLAPQIALADSPNELLDNLDLLLLSGNMTESTRDALLDHLALFGDTEEDKSQAVRDVISLIMASPDYLVQL